MAYVMVPVPEDQVQEVMQYIVRLMARAEVTPWNAEALASLFDAIDEPSKALLATVADATAAGSTIAEQDAANAIQLSRREMVGIMRDVNEQAQEAGGPVLLARRAQAATLPNGQVTEVRVLAMSDEIAPLVQQLDRAHLLADGGPSSDSNE